MIRAQPATPQRNERVFALLELMLSLRTRPSLSVARTVPKPDHLGPFGAGWRPLSGSPHVPHTNAQFCAAREAWLRSQLPPPPLSSAPPPTADSRLQLPDQLTTTPQPRPTLRAWRSARPFIGPERRGLTSDLSPLTPTGSAPFWQIRPIMVVAIVSHSRILVTKFHQNCPRVRDVVSSL